MFFNLSSKFLMASGCKSTLNFVCNQLTKPKFQSSIYCQRSIITKSPKKRIPIYKSKSDSDKKVTGFGYFLMLVPITTAGLGTWQVYRKKWKEDLIKKMESQFNEPARSLPDDLSELSKMEYQTVRVKGHFIHEKELFLGPRGLIRQDGDESGGGLFSQKNQTNGYLVITPFKLEGREETILVNRGWVSRGHLNPETRIKGQIKGDIEINGIVRLNEPRPQFTPDHKGGNFLYRDLPRMTAMTGAEPIYIDAKFDSTVDGGPIGGQTRVTLRNEHLSYIFTWYSLSAFTSYLWYRQIFRKLPF